jgi:hypothetical protein
MLMWNPDDVTVEMQWSKKPKLSAYKTVAAPDVYGMK